VKFLTNNFLDISQKKFGSVYALSPRKCLNIEILAKSEGKEAIFFYLGKKKIQIISCLCTFNKFTLECLSTDSQETLAYPPHILFRVMEATQK
jgi:hypothetical protein